MKYNLLFFVLILVFSVAPCSAGEDVKMEISSPVFEHNGRIPGKYTCDGKNVNPPLIIKNVPSNAKSLALIVEDPDAPMGTWVHWVLWNIKPGIEKINENSVPRGARQGLNDFRKRAYGGPCPPSGTHRYFFKLYALDTRLSPGRNSKKTDLIEAMKGHIIAKAGIIGLYRRR